MVQRRGKPPQAGEPKRPRRAVTAGQDQVTDFSMGRIVAIAALSGALVGGAIAGVVSLAATGGSGGSAAASSGGSGTVSTAAVVRTTLTNSVQEGGSIGFDGSYTVVAPSGTSPQQLAQAQQAVSKDQQSLSADEQAQSDATNADNQAIAAAQTSVTNSQSTLGANQATQAQDCAGSGASSPACNSDTQKISQDQNQLTQAHQQLAAAQDSATRDHDQDQAKVQSDQTTLQGDEAALALAQQDATNPGTTYTALPSVGEVIDEDQSAYSVSNQPVLLLYGSIAAYRAFYVGMSDGADVGELTADLIALGYGAGLDQANHYSSATAAAVERWQSALGLPATGEILLGAVVFEPGPIRVTAVTPSIGSSVGGGGGGGAGAGGGGGAGATVLTATSTTAIVTVDLDVSQEYLVNPGDAVTVVLPNGTSSVAGHIETVGNVATCPSGGGTGSGTGAQSGSSSASTSTCSSSGSGTNSGPTVLVTVTLDSTPAGSTLDQAPVNVDITTQTAAHVLAVPVNALLALQGGGYGLQVVTGTTSHLVGVSTGIYASNMVQVSGKDISAGTRVEVPAS
jgi:Putative peptidoglycan binding domain